MAPYDPEHYLNSPEVLLAQYKRRKMRRIFFCIDGVEPGSKKSMSSEDKDEIQKQLLEVLIKWRRRAFQGPILLRLNIYTSEKSPPHIQTIAKNLLDLFARPRTNLSTKRRGLLYYDDSQIHALSVTCTHGMDEPKIFVKAYPLRDFLMDITLAVQQAHKLQFDRTDWMEEHNFDNAVDSFKGVRRNEKDYRKQLGDDAFVILLTSFQRQAQEHMLGRATVSLEALASLYNIPNVKSEFTSIFEEMFHRSPLRIKLSELPQARGSSSLWKQEIDKKLNDFKEKLGWLTSPLLVPVSLEVIVKPPPSSRQKNKHDLDNILRVYLLPKVVETLSPVSDLSFTFEVDAMKQAVKKLGLDLELNTSMRSFQTPPASTKAGVTRYEVWQLSPAAEDSMGFVSIAVIPDMIGKEDLFQQIENTIEFWEESQ
jgi:hypothetical protein